MERAKGKPTLVFSRDSLMVYIKNNHLRGDVGQVFRTGSGGGIDPAGCAKSLRLQTQAIWVKEGLAFHRCKLAQNADRNALYRKFRLKMGCCQNRADGIAMVRIGDVADLAAMGQHWG